MGLKLFSSSSQDNKSVSIFSRWKSNSSFDSTPTTNTVILPNPRPDNYSVIRYEEKGDYLLIEIKYHDCNNYEGRKIMLYKCDYKTLMSQKLIDPHFCNNEKYISPIMRLEPTKEGWQNGINFIERCG